MQGKPTTEQAHTPLPYPEYERDQELVQKYGALSPFEVMLRLEAYEAALKEIADSPGSEKHSVIARKALELK